jgi:hypothetical protein
MGSVQRSVLNAVEKQDKRPNYDQNKNQINFLELETELKYLKNAV